MSDITGEPQTRVEVKGDRPLVVKAETASDEVFSAVANERRRHVLAVIAEESAAMDLSTLVERVAERLTPEGSGEVPDRTNLSVALRHQHLPKMASAGLVEYDAESQSIEATEAIQT